MSATRYGRWRRSLARDLSGTVLELGAGEGDNLPFLPAGVTWIGLEPDRRRAAVLRAQVGARPAGGAVLECTAESIPLPDHSVDAVLGTLVLCSVTDQGAVLAEVRRVLRPGGSYFFLEHVAAPKGSLTRRLQQAYAPLSRLLDHGCHPARETEAAIEAAGFTELSIERFSLPALPGLTVAHLAGTAAVA